MCAKKISTKLVPFIRTGENKRTDVHMCSREKKKLLCSNKIRSRLFLPGFIRVLDNAHHTKQIFNYNFIN